MPPGSTPPFIIRYSASNVPILQVALESESLSEQQLFDYGVLWRPSHNDPYAKYAVM
jgi:multidrug efflux pump subunit AcrB